MELRQVTDTTTVGSGAQYVCTSWIDTANTDPMPDAGIFLYRIISASRPSSDRFARVCTPADITTFRADRAEAVIRRHAYWRSNQYVRTDTSLQVAVSARVAVKDLVDQLAKTWTSYEADFDAAGQPSGYYSYSIPQVEETTRNQLIAAYTAARDAQAQTEEDLDAATVQINALTSTQSSLTTQVEYLLAAKAALLSAQSDAAALPAGAKALRTQARTYIGVVEAGLEAYSDEYPADPGDDTWDHFGDDPPFSGSVVTATAAFRSDLETWSGLIGAWDGASSDISEAYSQVSAAHTSATAALSSTTTSLSTQTRLRAQLQQTLSEQTNATFLARAALTSYCPDINPDTL